VTLSGNEPGPSVAGVHELDGRDDVTVTGSTVPRTGGTMASLDNSC
jgi:hypothetical protein